MPRPNIPTLRDDTALTHLEKWFFVCLTDLCDERGRCQRSVRELHRLTHVSLGGISEMLHHLVEMGYIRASPSPDGRGKDTWLIFLTEKGLLGDNETLPPKPPATMPDPATIEAGDIRIKISFEPREY